MYLKTIHECFSGRDENSRNDLPYIDVILNVLVLLGRRDATRPLECGTHYPVDLLIRHTNLKLYLAALYNPLLNIFHVCLIAR
jgi:hypothetical protein